jgi:hypothetical protein
VHGTGVYSAGVGPKGPALERFLDIKKKKLKRGIFSIQFNVCKNTYRSCMHGLKFLILISVDIFLLDMSMGT